MLLELIEKTATSKGNTLLKLRNKTSISVETEFGTVSSERQSTYYMFVVGTSALEVGFKADLDLSKFDTVERDYEHPEAGNIILKYLYTKR